MPTSQVTVTVDSKIAPIFALIGAVVGLVLALLVGPVVSWMLERFDSAPVILRLIDLTPWSMPVLIVLGAVAGWIVFSIWNSEVGRVVVDEKQVRIAAEKTSAVYRRDEIAEIFLDKDELVLVDYQARELSRSTSEAGLARKLEAAFTTFDYPWAGAGDPWNDAFVEWVDHSPELDQDIHVLLRRRQRALDDGRRGEAADLRDALTNRGVVVRDRNNRQQYRLIADA